MGEIYAETLALQVKLGESILAIAKGPHPSVNANLA